MLLQQNETFVSVEISLTWSIVPETNNVKTITNYVASKLVCLSRLWTISAMAARPFDSYELCHIAPCLMPVSP